MVLHCFPPPDPIGRLLDLHILPGPAVHAFFERLSPESITLRFFCGFPNLDRAVRWATDVDDQHRYGLIATSSADGRVVGHAEAQGSSRSAVDDGRAPQRSANSSARTFSPHITRPVSAKP